MDEQDVTVDVADLMDEADAPPPDPAALAVANAIAPPPNDPTMPPYPRGLILDIVLKTAPIAELLPAYKMTVDEFKALTKHPLFLQDLRDTKARLREEGWTFKVKLQAQAEQYLHEAWRLVHSPDTPANTKADLIKWSVKASGLEAKPDVQDPAAAFPQMAEQMKNLPAGELEMRVYQILLRKGAVSPTPQGVTYAHEPS